jgi:transposase
LTVVVDKGMNSEANMQAIDKQAKVDFVTTYSPAFAEDLAQTDLENFVPVDTRKNRELAARGRQDDQMVAWRTTGFFWGATRTVVVTYNPRTAAKQRYRFDQKLGKLQNGLFELRARVRAGNKALKSKEQVKARYKDLCESLYLPKNLYKIEFVTTGKQLKMYFRKDHYQISKHVKRFGKNIIITSHDDWNTEAIVQASLDRYQVENAFRQSKGNEFGNFRPVWHWTDGKIRCHLFACLIALTYLQLIALQLKKAGLNYSVDQAMKSMRNLSSCLCWGKGKRKPTRIIEEPSEEQAAILKSFGYKIRNGVLQGPSK